MRQTYYFSTHGCNLVLSSFDPLEAFEEPAPEAAASFLAFKSKKLAMMSAVVEFRCLCDSSSFLVFVVDASRWVGRVGATIPDQGR